MTDDSAASAADRAQTWAVSRRLAELMGELGAEDLPFLQAMVFGFRPKAERLGQAWADAVARDDVDAAALAVHTLRGAALNLGGDSFAALCSQVEKRTHQGTVDVTADRTALDAGAGCLQDLLEQAWGRVTAAGIPSASA